MLVLNWHEPYICLYAAMGHQFDVAPPPQNPEKRWNQGFRPLPDNVTEISWESAEEGARTGRYDLFVGLTLQDVQTVQEWDLPRLFVMLNMIGTDAGLDGAEKEAYVERLRPFFREVDISFISEKKRRNWGWEAPVVVSGIDPDDYGGFTGENARVLRVGNMLKERDHMQGFGIQEEILGDGIPSAIVGVNPTIPESHASESWEDLKEQYRRNRVLLCTLTNGHEDGYNLAILEAMATGMPVVSIANSSSPIVDGYNGFISDDYDYLREKLRLLLADGELATELGRNARQTVVEKFHIRDCAAAWEEVFADTVGRWRDRRGGTAASAGVASAAEAPKVEEKRPEGGGKRLKILLAAPANPLSTSAYYERALRRGHEVITCGPRLDEGMMAQWKEWEDQHAFKPAGVGDADKMGLLSRLVRDNDVPLPWGEVAAEELSSRLPAGWRPDLVLWVDAGREFLLRNPGHFDCPTACLIGDTHTDQREWRIDYARQFDQVFLMFVRQHMQAFGEAGCRRVAWLPAACDPEIHRRFDVPKAYDVVFVGQTLPQWHAERVRLLERLQQAGFDLRVDSKVLEEMALLFSRGRIVFNRSLNDDLNMRVPEALACGSLLLTDRLSPEAGLEELFTDRQQLVLYDEGNLEELARYYLEHEAEREEIAARGRQEVIARHTYGHRADQLLAELFGQGEVASCVIEGAVEESTAAAVPTPLPVVAPSVPAEPELPSYYHNIRPEVIGLIPAEAVRVLEIGCAAGAMGRNLKEQRPEVEVVGVELNPQAAELARDRLDAVICGDIEEFEFLPYPHEYFDCITFGDVLEHLRDPEALLKRLLPYLHPDGVLICSIPNIRHQSVMLNLMVNGRWEYQDEGLLDRTHIHFFTLAEIRVMMDRLGLDMEQVTASSSPPLAQMEPFIRATAELGGDGEQLRQESQIIQYIFRAGRPGRGSGRTEEKAALGRDESVPRSGAETASRAGEGSDPRVSVIIPVYNKAEFTEQCLYGLVANTEEDPDYEVILVDNGSTDWTIYLTHAFEGDLRVLRNDENQGFARANNQGAQAARGEYLVFLNNDTVPHPGWLREMVRLADADPQVGIVGAKLLYPESGQIQHAGLEMVNGIPEHVFRGAEGDDPRVNQVRDLDMVTGACLMISRELFAELGGFDVGFLNGVEDIDLCLRVRELGRRVVYCPTSVVDHHEGTTEGRFDRVQENLQRFVQKWQGRFDGSGRLVVGVADEQIEVELEKQIFRGNWEGSFFLHSSLAHVNRELVLGLLGTGRCELGLIPFEPHQFGLEENPERFGPLAERMDKRLEEGVDFHLRHRWPPDFSRPTAGKLVLVQPWEFGRIPQSWVQPLRDQVDQVWAYTSYVRNCYIDSGIDPDQVEVVPLGVDVQTFRPGLEPLELPTERSFKFLFVGGTLYRKGIDLLLTAYRNSFAPGDDVCLVIKDMGTKTFYRDQNAGAQIEALREDPNCPEIVYLTDDLPGDQIARLYASCDCLVHPYRGEGFGLPVAEGMACGLPVIVTAGGACDDFCSGDTGYMIPALRRQVQFQEPTVGPAWLLEPDGEALEQFLRQVCDDPIQAREKGRRGAEQVHRHCTWENAAEHALEALGRLMVRPDAASRGSIPAESDRPLPEKGGNAEVVVLGGGDAGAVETLSAELGEQLIRYDVALESGEVLGEQLGAIRDASQGEFLFILQRGTDCPRETWGRLLEEMRGQPQIGIAGPGLAGEAAGVGAEDVDYLTPACLVVRGAALDAIGGFEGTFRTPAVLDELMRCCRRGGWRTVRVADGALAGRATPFVEPAGTGAEREAVRALEEGDRCRAAGEFAAAEQAYRRALEEKSDYVEPIVVLSSMLLEQGRPEEGAEVVEQLVAMEERSFQAHNLLGLARYQARDWERARASFERALELHPDSVEVLVNLSVLEWGQEEGDRALDYLERAAELDPGNRDVIVNTGLIQAQVGNGEAALAIFREYAGHHAGDIEVKSLLIDILMQSGEVEEARQVAGQILQVQPRHAKARAIAESASGQENKEEE